MRVITTPTQNIIVAESTSTTWTVGDAVEEIITPYPDISGFQFHVAEWTPGGIRRTMWEIDNIGAQTWGSVLNVDQNMPTGGAAAGWENIILSAATFSGYMFNFPDAISALRTQSSLCYERRFGD